MSSKGSTLVTNKYEHLKVSTFNFLENERTYNYTERGRVHEVSKISAPVKLSERSINSSSNFIENERNTDFVQRGGVFQLPKTIPRIGDSTQEILSSSNAYLAEQPVSSRSQMTSAVTETRQENGIYAPKRYTTTCYFKPKQNPVSYSETVILVLGSKKKHYFDTVLYQTKLVPFRWTETLATVTKASEQQIYQAHHEAFIQEPPHHYMSLEPQQTSATRRLEAEVSA